MQKIYIVPQHIEKGSSKQIRFLCHYNFVDRCNVIINLYRRRRRHPSVSGDDGVAWLYKQQQNIDSLSNKG